MKKFKLFFYPIYVVSALVVMYFSIDILVNMDSYIDKLDFATLRKLPNYALAGFLFLTLIMVVELIAENIHVVRLRKKAKDAQDEVLRLKAKLFDQVDQAPAPPSSQPLLDLSEIDSFDEEENDEDEDENR